MKVLVTGGNGFIGKHVCKNLNERGIQVLVFDRTGSSNICGVRGSLGDVKDYESVIEAVGTCDGVISH